MKDYSFGNHICALRMRRGLSQFQLGTLVGVSDKAVSKWENGDAKPRISTCFRLAEILGISINELLSCEQTIALPARKERKNMNDKLWKKAYEKLSVYGGNPPIECWSRLIAEEEALRDTDAIQGAAVVGEMAKKAKEHGTMILARGGIENSFAAWLFGATAVNPLPAHYRCPNCGTTEFVTGRIDGYDLAPKLCGCGHELYRDGHRIPYEGYAQEERKGTHLELLVTEEFKPTAIKILQDFYEGVAEILPVRLVGKNNEWIIDRYVVLMEQQRKPKPDADGFWHVGCEEYFRWQNGETTFTFLVGEVLEKLQRLQKITKISLPEIDALKTSEIAEAIYQKKCSEISHITDKLGEEKHDFDLLLRVESLHRSTGEWEDNGEILLEGSAAKFREIPATREDIWDDICCALQKKGIADKGLPIQVVKNVRLGRYQRKGMTNEMETLLNSLELPSWYTDYLQKILYVFPKGHCTAFLHIDMLFAWYQLHFPEQSKQC